MSNKNKYKLVEQFLIKNVVGRSSAELAELVNKEYGTAFTSKEMQQFKKARKITAGKYTRYSDTFPREVAEYIKANHKGVGHKQQAENLRCIFGREYTVAQIKGFYRNNRLNSGLTGRFEPGHIPANKGKHVETKGRMAETQFKKGNKPHNLEPVGTTVVRTDGYLRTKIAEPNVWKLTHLIEWEKHYGPKPEDMLLEFRDGDRHNCSIDNLRLVTKQEHVEMNRNNSALRSRVPELSDAGYKVAQIRIAAREHRKTKR